MRETLRTAGVAAGRRGEPAGDAGEDEHGEPQHGGHREEPGALAEQPQPRAGRLGTFHSRYVAVKIYA